ncbi:ChbG/HpnK family deacetylase [Georgenia sp. MJ173]|uniref:carbohydrate deacetylase n=1 Tax=Georgenia sunbinii TaxID=3117728 RepID=UPI002F26CFA1
MGRTLVITADDLGIDPRTNATIVALLREGRLSATTLIPVAAAADDAVRRITAAGLQPPHLHFTISSGRGHAPWRPLAEDVPSLVDGTGHLPVDARTAERSATVPDVQRELHAQLAWMRAAGMPPRVLDSHSGTLYGMHGRSLADVAVDFCAEHQLAFRLPRRLGRLLAVGVPGLRRAHDLAVPQADRLGVRLPQSLVSAWLPGRFIARYAQLRAEVLWQLRRLPPGTSELMVHPSPPSAAQAMPPTEGRKRVWELRLLRDPVFTRTLQEEEITVVPAW